MGRVKEEIDFTKFITAYYPLEEIQDAFDRAIEHKDEAVKVMILANEEKEKLSDLRIFK